MQRGTRVGQAYVALAVDGDKVNEQIIDAFDDVDYDKLGEDGAEEYGEARKKRLQKYNEAMEADFAKALKRISRAIDTDIAIEQNIQNQLAKAFGSGDLDRLIRDIGERIGVQMGDGFDDTLNAAVLDSLEKSLVKAARSGQKHGTSNGLIRIFSPDDGKKDMHVLGAFIDSAVADAQRAVETVKKDQINAEKAVWTVREKTFKARLRHEREIEAVAARVARDREKVERDMDKMWNSLLDERERKEIAAEKEVWRVRNLGFKARLQWEREVEAARVRSERAVGTERERQARLAAKAEREAAKALEDRYNRIGAVFGRGSRNNFLNVIGGTVRAVTKGLDTMFTLGKRTVNFLADIPKFAGMFADGMKQAGDQASIFGKIMGGLGENGLNVTAVFAKMGPAIAVAVAVAVAAFVAAIAVASVLVSVLSALAGIVTALVGALTAGLTAALAVAGGAMVAVIGIAGLLTNAFMSMTDAQRAAFKEDVFTPLKESMVGIGQIMLEDMVPAFKTWGENLKGMVELLIPVAGVMGKAFAEAGNILTASLSGPGFQKLSEAFTKFLPGITTSLTSALGGFLNGLAGMFAALMPYVQDFADWLNRVATDFSEWANSAEGQNSIEDWMDRALKSLKSVWGAVKEFGGLLKDVLFNEDTQQFGSDMFDGIRDSLKKFRKYIEDGKLEDWLKKARRFGEGLKGAMKGLSDTFTALDDAGVIDAVASGLEAFGRHASKAAKFVEKLTPLIEGGLKGALSLLDTAISPVTTGMENLASALDWAKRKFEDLKAALASGLPSISLPDIPHPGKFNPFGAIKDAVTGSKMSLLPKDLQTAVDQMYANGGSGSWGSKGRKRNGRKDPTFEDLVEIGNQALNETSVDHGGYKEDDDDDKTGGKTGGKGSAKDKGKKKAKKFINPYLEMAQALIQMTPTAKAEVRKAMKELTSGIASVLYEAVSSDDSAAVKESTFALSQDLRTGAADIVAGVKADLSAAAEDLAGAKNKKEMKAALAQVQEHQKALKRALKEQAAVEKAASIVSAQGLLDMRRVGKLVDGLSASNATLADYAEARKIIAEKLEKAEQALADAVAERDNFAASVRSTTESWAALTTAQAKVVDGVEQALTAKDITGNLQDRLAKIRTFQDNLRVLLASGLSDAAYKQIVGAGVDGGSAYADALVRGGPGAVAEVNNLVDQIGAAAEGLGNETADRLYKVGVDAAQGVVDGLASQLQAVEAAASALGERIAAAITKALQIKSPSRVMLGLMGYVGAGLVDGLDEQGDPVFDAATRLGRRIEDGIAPTPEAAMYSANTRAGLVSGNPTLRDGVLAGATGNVDIDLTVVSPTEDPKAVATEAINALVGRML